MIWDYNGILLEKATRLDIRNFDPSSQGFKPLEEPHRNFPRRDPYSRYLAK